MHVEHRDGKWRTEIPSSQMASVSSCPRSLSGETQSTHLRKHSPLRCPLLLWFVPFTPVSWMKGIERKWGVSFVFIRGVSRSLWEAIKYLVWAPRSMFHKMKNVDLLASSGGIIVIYLLSLITGRSNPFRGCTLLCVVFYGRYSPHSAKK